MATKKTADSTAAPVSKKDIEKRAQEIYEDRVKKNIPGTAESDWLAAEKELAKKKK